MARRMLKQIEDLKQNNQDLGSFADILAIIERKSNKLAINQVNPHLDPNWTKDSKTECGACIGALLLWYWDMDRNMARKDMTERWHEISTSSHTTNLTTKLNDVIMELMPAELPGYYAWKRGEGDPFGVDSWPVKPSTVFRELHKETKYYKGE